MLMAMVDNYPRIKHVPGSVNPCQYWVSEDSDGIK